jgi:hypothetical protein
VLAWHTWEADQATYHVNASTSGCSEKGARLANKVLMYATPDMQKVFKNIFIWLSYAGVKFGCMMLKMR